MNDLLLREGERSKVPKSTGTALLRGSKGTECGFQQHLCESYSVEVDSLGDKAYIWSERWPAKTESSSNTCLLTNVLKCCEVSFGTIEFQSKCGSFKSLSFKKPYTGMGQRLINLLHGDNYVKLESQNNFD